MTDERTCLPVGTTIELQSGARYRITGSPIGRGGGSILYPAENLSPQDSLPYVLKECYPASMDRSFTRDSRGEILPVHEEDLDYLQRAQTMQLEEKERSQAIYRTAARTLPVREGSQKIVLTRPGCPEQTVANTVTVMDSLAEKGRSLTDWIKEKKRFTALETLRIVQQLLFALREVHEAGFLHLDIQDGNVFLKGTLEDRNELVTLIDFGCSRAHTEGETDTIADRVIFTTQGFSAPEILYRNDGTLKLTPKADLYSVGCLALYLLTRQRPNVLELTKNTAGLYLRQKQLQKAKCPRHLWDAMQELLARALSADPEKRYASASAMLADVNTLLDALQPKKAEIAATKYDAFVCYKHGDIDSAAALSLQRALENYRAPKGVSKKSRPFHRVFVDEGELSSCADFGQQIREALKNSRWLIVICSPDTPLSPWVQQEIDTFLEYHDRSRILSVLTGGGPETAFPPQLKADENGNGEVFAAHAISRSPQEAAKNVRGDTLLKIAAPMLGTTYDTLKQRHKIYQLQRIAAVTAVFLLAALGFAAYAANRARVIADQAEQIQEEYEKALINESLFLSEQAEKRLAENDPLAAMELALQALPSEQQPRPLLTEAEYVLGKALNIYSTPASTEMTASIVGKVETEYPYLLSDPTGRRLLAWDDWTLEGSAIRAWDAETLSPLWEHQAQGGLCDQPVVSQNGDVVLPFYNSILALDADNGQAKWNVEIPNLQRILQSRDGARLLAISGDRRGELWAEEDSPLPYDVTVHILSMETGEIVKQTTFPMERKRAISNDFAVSEDLKWAAFSTYNAEEWLNDYYEFNAVYLVNLETCACTQILDSETQVEDMLFADQKLILTRGHGETLSTRKNKTPITYNKPESYWLESYDIPSGKVLWSIGQTTHLDFSSFIRLFRFPEDMETTFPAENGILLVYHDQVLWVDCTTGQILRQYQLPGGATSVHLADYGFRAVCTSGTMCLVPLVGDTVNQFGCFDNAVSESCQGNGNYFIQYTSLLNRNNTIYKYRANVFDEGYVQLFETNSRAWRPFSYGIWEGSLRFLLCQDDGRKVCLADTASGTSREYEIPEELPFSSYDLLGASADGHRLYWSDQENSECWIDSKDYYVLDFMTGTVRRISPPEKPKKVLSARGSVFDGETLLFLAKGYEDKSDQHLLYRWDLTAGTLEEVSCYSVSLEQPEAETGSIAGYENLLYKSFLLDSENRRIFFAMCEFQTETPTRLIAVDLTTGAQTVIPLSLPAPKKTSDFAYKAWQSCAYRWNGSGTRAVFCYNDRITVVDLTGTVLCSIPTEEPLVSLRFAPNEEYLLAVTQRGMLNKYRIADSRLCASFALSEYSSGFFSLYEGDWEWCFLDENTLLGVTDYGSFLLDISQETIKIKATVDQRIGYDSIADRLIAVDINAYWGNNTTIGTFPRYTVEDLIQKANAILNK